MILAQGLAKQCSSLEGVTTITLSKSMLKFASTASTSSPLNFSKLMEKLDHVEIISCDKEYLVPRVDSLVKSYISGKKDFEELLNITDADNTLVLYMRKVDKDKMEYLITVNEKSEINVFIIIGSMTPEEVAEGFDF